MHPLALSINAVVTIPLDDYLVHSVRESLIPETKTPSSNRSSTVIEMDENHIIIKTDADDISALRANLNSYMRWVQSIQEVVNNLNDSQKP